MPPVSVLDLAFVPEGGTPADALRNTLDLAQHAEKWCYRRFWLAEHHNMVGIASAATAVVISHVAAGTRCLRITRKRPDRTYILRSDLGWKCIKIKQPKAIGGTREIAPPSIY
jgi:Luciferase-like monooxygenase